MGEKRKAAPVVETGDGGAGQFVIADVLLSRQQYNTGPRQAQGAISALLLPGAGNAVPLRRLAAMIGRDERDVRRAIRRERLAGVPILADNRSGYFLPACGEELAGCVRSLRHRARQILAAADAIEAARDGEGGA